MVEPIERYLERYGYKELSIKAVFFDMDGVLFDSMPFHAEAWVKVMVEQGIPFTAHDAYMNEGRTGASTINEYFLKYKGREATTSEIEALYKQKSDYFNQINKITPIPTIEKVLHFLRLKGVECFVVTGSGQRSLFDVLDTYFTDIFSVDKMVTAYDVKFGKPHPEPYLMALEKSGLHPWEVLVVENAPLGVKSAVAAGLFTIAINTGILFPQELAQEGANLVLDDMKSLLEILEVIL